MTTAELDEAVAIVRHVKDLRLARERCALATQIRVVGDTGSSGWVTVDLSPSEGAVFMAAFDVLLAKCADRLQALGVNDRLGDDITAALNDWPTEYSEGVDR